jgi:NAD+ synthase (glutamine-hydrolysing)
MNRVRVALSQLDTVVGDIETNVDRVRTHIRMAEAHGVDLVAFPELSITGYPPEDLLLKPAFITDNLSALSEVAAETQECVALVGFVDLARSANVPEAVAAALGTGKIAREAAVRGAPRRLRNALAVCSEGRVVDVYHKRLLPNYGVFDEDRWFAPGIHDPRLYEIAGVLVGVSICEDMWFPEGPLARQAQGGAQLVVNVNSSPFSVRRLAERLSLLEERVAQSGCAIAYVNQVGGQDELVFDGGSLVLDASGSIVAAAAQFEETMLLVDVVVGDTPRDGALGSGHSTRGGRTGALEVISLSASPRDPEQLPPPPLPQDLSEEAEVYEALVLGTRDYLSKNGFTDAVLGLSGGIDSSLVAAIAVDALGAEHVHGLAMPSRYSSESSAADAGTLAKRLGIEIELVPIEEAHVAFASMLDPVLGGLPSGLCDENLQSRIRGVLLMAMSNAEGWIVLTTGNKSELATGYSTLYGDSAGGFAVIKDVPKTLVYRLCRYRNALAGTDLIPQSVLDKAPSAELRPDQRDVDSLPPYDVLDPVLDLLVANDRSIDEVVAEGFDPALVAKVARLLDSAEYKRRQYPPGVRISAKAFGKDRRMPITNRYRDRSYADPPGEEIGGRS